ncbi:hypothetical protein D3C85_1249090 [compost metagenome]
MRVANCRLLKNFSPKVSSSPVRDMPVARPVANPAAVTTSSGLNLSANPSTTTGIPISGNNRLPSMQSSPFHVNATAVA